MKIFSKKIFLYMTLAILLAPAAISAKVYFLEAEDESAGALNLVIPCRINYPLETCPDGKNPQNFCPTDNRYFQTCGCDSTAYQYDSTNCTGNKTLGGTACDGKYASCSCDSTKYMYDSTNCGDGKVLGGNSCDGKYETCGCDSTYSKTCSSPLVGSGSACDGKYQSCKCPSSYLTCDNGGDTGATSCTEENGTVKYSSCKAGTCEDNNYSSYVPSGQTCTQVTYNSLTCYKDCKEEYLKVSLSSTYGASSVTTITSDDTAWTYENNASWVTATKTSTGLSLSVTSNSSTSSRTATIRVKHANYAQNGLVKVITISQNQASTTSKSVVNVYFPQTTYWSSKSLLHNSSNSFLQIKQIGWSKDGTGPLTSGSRYVRIWWNTPLTKGTTYTLYVAGSLKIDTGSYYAGFRVANASSIYTVPASSDYIYTAGFHGKNTHTFDKTEGIEFTPTTSGSTIMVELLENFVSEYNTETVTAEMKLSTFDLKTKTTTSETNASFSVD